MSDPIDFVTGADAETLYAYTIAVLAIAVCAVLALANSTLSAKYRQARLDLQAAQRSARARDRELMRLRWEHSVLVGAQLTAEQHLGLDGPATFNPGPAPSWAWQPLPADTPDLCQPDPAGIRTLADRTAEYDLTALEAMLTTERTRRVPAVADGVPS